LHILHIFDHSLPLHSGYAFRSKAIIEQQRALGWHTTQLTGAKHDAGPLLHETVEGLEFQRTPVQRGVIDALPVMRQLVVITGLQRRIDELVRMDRPDVIHAHSPALNGVAALRVGARHGIPVVYEYRASWEDAAVDHGTSTEGGVRYRLTRALENFVFHRVAHVTTICEGLRSDILARGVAPERVTVIPNAVEPERFTSVPRDDALARELGLSGKVVLGFIGSFYGYEGLPLLLESLPLLMRERPEVAVLLVGGGPEEARLRAAAATLPRDARVVFTGRVPHGEIDRYYGLVDVFVYPRLSMRLTETVTPLKPLEAMAKRTLIVASDVGGHRELIRDGETGCLFRPGDAGDLARKVSALLEDRGRWPAMREAARRFVEEERTWRASVARYIPVYGALTGQDRGRARTAHAVH
jgi:glycogen synthase